MPNLLIVLKTELKINKYTNVNKGVIGLVKGTGILREMNKRKLLSLIRKHGKTSRQDLVNLMNVSKNTVSMIVDELIKQNILQEVGEKGAGKKGRPKIIIQIREDSLKAIGISISKHNMNYSVINYYGDNIESESFKYNCSNPIKTKNKILEIVRNLLIRFDNIIGVGIGIPGIVDSDKKYVHESTHLGWHDLSLDEFNILSIPVVIQNSVNMGAIQALNSEHQSNNGSLFYLRVSEGVGGSYVINNNVIEGGSWTAGEIGHISVDTEGKLCVCGQKGCLEQLVNYNALVNDLKNIGLHPPILSSENIPFDNNHLKSSEVKELMSKYGINFGKALVYIVHLLNPNKVILDSPYNVFDDFRQSCLNYIQENALQITTKNTELIFGKQRYHLSRGAALSIIINYEMIISIV